MAGEEMTGLGIVGAYWGSISCGDDRQLVYAQLTYSALNPVSPGNAAISAPQNPGTETVSLTLTPSSSQLPPLCPFCGNSSKKHRLPHWRIGPKTRLSPPQTISSLSDADQIQACVNYGQSEICAILEEMSTAPDVILRQQFLVAIMNYLSGADTGAIGNTINEAYEWLRTHSSAAPIPEADLQTAQLYANTLQSLNQGDISPGACEIEFIPLTQAEAPASSPRRTA
jgi:hypothetical protein